MVVVGGVMVGEGEGSVTNFTGKLMPATELLPRKVLGRKYSQYVAQSFRGSLDPLRARARSPSLDNTLPLVGFTPTEQKLALLLHSSVGGAASTLAPRPRATFPRPPGSVPTVSHSPWLGVEYSTCSAFEGLKKKKKKGKTQQTQV